MPTNQFTIYKSTDIQGPGPVKGLSGSLIRILNACLVDGYGSGSYRKEPAGWSKPLPDTGSIYYGNTNVLACYKQGSGSMMTLFVNDSGHATNDYANIAIAQGWELITSLIATSNPSYIIFSGSNQLGNGIRPFPTPTQMITYTYTFIGINTTCFE